MLGNLTKEQREEMLEKARAAREDKRLLSNLYEERNKC